jgi:hypothetical protein
VSPEPLISWGAREQLLAQIWNEMQKLQFLGGLLSKDHDDTYKDYRDNYEQALLKMRQSLVPKNAAQSTMTVGSAQGVTRPSSSNPP